MRSLIKNFSFTRFKKIFFGLLYFIQIIFILCSTKFIEKIYDEYFLNKPYIKLLLYYNNFLTTSKYFIVLDFIIYFIPYSKYDLKNINTLFFVMYDLIINYKNSIEMYENFYILENKFFLSILTIFIIIKTKFQICTLLNIVYIICYNIFVKKETKINKIFDLEYDIENGFEY